MNRLLVEGNFYGGLVQGIGLALTEDFEDLNHDTSLKNLSLIHISKVSKRWIFRSGKAALIREENSPRKTPSSATFPGISN